MKLYKPLYQCEGCSETHEDPDKVRIFESIVKSGDESKQYIKSGMFCLSCIPLALDFENKVPETVQIVDPQKALADSENLFEEQYKKILDKLTQDNYVHFGTQEEHLTKLKLTELETDLADIKKRHNMIVDILNNISRDIKLNDTRLLAIETVILAPEFKETSKTFVEKQESINSLTHDDELTETYVDHITSTKDSQTTSQEPETTTENINSETEEDEFGEDHGRYLILKLIDNEVTERKFAQKQGYKDTKDLWEACGLRSLIGIYYSTNKYSDITFDNQQFKEKVSVKVINKMFFGIPNIVQRMVYLYQDIDIALIEKDSFVDTIKSVSFGVAESSKNMEMIIQKGEENLVPNISKDKLKSFVVDAARSLNETNSNEYKEQETGFRELQEQAKETENPIITSTQKRKFSREKIGDDYL